MSICYRWCGTQWGFGSSACVVSVARVRVSVPRWNLNGGYSWVFQIDTHTLPCTKLKEEHMRGKKEARIWARKPSEAQMNYCNYLFYICCPDWAPFTGRVVFPLFTSSACLWVGVWLLVVGRVIFFFFFKVGTKGCLLSTTSSLLIQKNTHDSRTLPPPPPPACQSHSEPGDFPERPCPREC